MQFTQEIQRVFIALMVAFIVIGLSASYWAVIGTEGLLGRDDNGRLFEDIARTVRGTIYDRHNIPLVESIANENGRISRNYLYPETYGVTGYYSLQYGVGGAEAAYDDILKGANLPKTLNTFIEEDLLHRPHLGAEVRLTIDLEIQREIVATMDGYTGAVVVLAVPSGEVLGLASLPTFDPNQLDSTWDELRDSLEQPFFNRALQGKYQPGGILQTPLMTAALITNQALDEPEEGASEAITVDGVSLDCAGRPPSDRLTLAESYAFACPAPFKDLYETLGSETITEVFNLFQFEENFTIAGFTGSDVENVIILNVPLTLDDILGQGTLTVTPLHMAMIAASVINEGNAPYPYLLHSIRNPGEDWAPNRELLQSIPITTPETSLQLQRVMRESTQYGAARDAARSDITIGGHAAIAFSGEKTLTWFIGNAITGQNQGIAVALILEDLDDTREASHIGGQILETAYTLALRTTNTAD